MSREKGSALISVILVVLVLTMVGVASLFFMTTEDRIANVGRLERAAFYAAETGLRAAEASVRTQYQLDTQICTTLLTRSTTTFYVPNGGRTHPNAVIFTDPAVSEHQDPVTGATIPAGEMRSIDLAGNEGYFVTYDAYVRNDDQEMRDDADFNNRISVIIVGTVTTVGGQTIRKVLEEQLGPATSSGGIGSQPGVNEGGTGSANTGAPVHL